MDSESWSASWSTTPCGTGEAEQSGQLAFILMQVTHPAAQQRSALRHPAPRRSSTLPAGGEHPKASSARLQHLLGHVHLGLGLVCVAGVEEGCIYEWAPRRGRAPGSASTRARKQGPVPCVPHNTRSPALGL